MEDEQELPEEVSVWIEEHRDELEYDFLNRVISGDRQPLDDDISDFFDMYADEFEEFAMKEFNKTLWQKDE